ncbi:MAG: glycosyltransferase [Candidatus Omnitrophica bacterium]|nr:glycosyltransferase [Candidatus Omnitrophota bacterium]
MNERENPIRTTVVVVPRESFNMFPEVVRGVYEKTSPIFKMLVMEGNAPEFIRKELRALEKAKPNCKIIWSDKFRYPHEFVNQAIKLVDTEYVVFIDNDVEVDAGWLEALVTCADEEKVGCVHPVYLTVKLNDPTRKIHVAEGRLLRKRMANGQILLDSTMPYSGVSLEQYPDRRRKESEFFEWHGVLFRKSLLDKIGPLDDLNIAEHVDYSLRIRNAGEKILLEPKSVVAYEYERIFRLDPVSKRYFLYRWDVGRSSASLDKFRSKWNLHPLSTARRLHWVKEHSNKVRYSLMPYRILNKVRRMLGMGNLPFSKEPRLHIPEIEQLQKESSVVRREEVGAAAN